MTETAHIVPGSGPHDGIAPRQLRGKADARQILIGYQLGFRAKLEVCSASDIEELRVSGVRMIL